MNTHVLPTLFGQRLLSLACYLGLAPFIALWGRGARRPLPPLVQHHLRQATGIFLLLCLVILLFILVVASISVAIVLDRHFYQDSQIEAFALNTTRRLFLCWLVFWVFGAGLALGASDRPMPLVGWLARGKYARRATWGLLLGLHTLLLALTPFAVYTAHLTPPAAPPGPVVLLYEDNDTFPRWLFTLGFYPVTRAGLERFGPGSVQVSKLSEQSLRNALATAQFLFIGSHGGKSGIMINKHYYAPKQLAGLTVNPSLHFVYLAGCDSGTLRQEWEKAFAPAHVYTYDRLTAVAEHAWWLWTEGPEAVRELP